MAFDRVKVLPVAAMPCGMSSRLVQVTVVPAFTVRVCGAKVKLSMATADAAGVWVWALATITPPASPEPMNAPTTAAAIAFRNMVRSSTLLAIAEASASARAFFGCFQKQDRGRL